MRVLLSILGMTVAIVGFVFMYSSISNTDSGTGLLAQIDWQCPNIDDPLYHDQASAPVCKDERLYPDGDWACRNPRTGTWFRTTRGPKATHYKGCPRSATIDDHCIAESTKGCSESCWFGYFCSCSCPQQQTEVFYLNCASQDGKGKKTPQWPDDPVLTNPPGNC